MVEERGNRGGEEEEEEESGLHMPVPPCCGCLLPTDFREGERARGEGQRERDWGIEDRRKER